MQTTLPFPDAQRRKLVSDVKFTFFDGHRTKLQPHMRNTATRMFTSGVTLLTGLKQLHSVRSKIFLIKRLGVEKKKLCYSDFRHRAAINICALTLFFSSLHAGVFDGTLGDVFNAHIMMHEHIPHTHTTPRTPQHTHTHSNTNRHSSTHTHIINDKRKTHTHTHQTHMPTQNDQTYYQVQNTYLPSVTRSKKI